MLPGAFDHRAADVLLEHARGDFIGTRNVDFVTSPGVERE